MKKIYAYAFGVLMLAGFAAFAPAASAQVYGGAVFNNNAFGIDCPTIAVANATTGTPTDSNNCWGTSTSATSNDVVNAVIYYHNNGNVTAHNTYIRLSPQSAGASSNITFSGNVMATNSPSASGSAVISISPAQTITFGTVKWYKDKNLSSPTPLPNSQTGAELFTTGVNIGDVLGYDTCPVIGGIRDAACHEGWLMVSYRIGNTIVPPPTTCDITVTPAATSIPYNGSTNISWNATNCNNFSINGPNISSTNPSGNQSTGQLTASATYLARGYSANGQLVTRQADVSVGTVPTPLACQITNFTGPTSVPSGQTATLSWNTQNCANITVSGQNVSFVASPYSNPSMVNSGSTVTGAVYSTTLYTMTASNSAGTPAVPWYWTVTTSTVVNNCTASLTPSQTQVAQGQMATLSWTSSGCSYVNISGPNGTISSAWTGSQQTPAIYGPVTYTLTATGTNTVNQSVTITTYTNNQNNTISVTTNAATNTANNSATLNGYIYVNGSCYYPCSNSGTYYFLYGTSSYNMYSQTPTQTFYNSSGPVSAYLNNLQPNTVYYFQLVAQNGNGTQYGGTLSFTTPTSGLSSVTALTLLATNVFQTSARLNGLVATPVNTYGTTYFEYGTTQALGRQSTAQNIVVGGSTNYFDTITTSANTTYFYRIVAVVGGQTYYGSIISFTTLDNTAPVPPVVITRVVGTGTGSAFVSLSIDDQSQTVNPGSSMIYTVKYKNISNSTLSNAILNVILPAGVTFRQTSQGLYTTNNTIAVSLGTLVPATEGTIMITAESNQTISSGDTLVATATLAFTIPSKAQDTAIAYDIDTVSTQNSLAGLALFGAGFFPTSFLGWILLLGIILVIILMARYFYNRGNAQAPVPAHQYYGPQQPPMQNMQQPMNNGGAYQGDHLPH